MSRDYTLEEIQTIVKSCIGHTFGELNNHKLTETEYDKGSFGHIFEKDVFDYDINSFSEADFSSAGIELKVTPYLKNKNGTLSAKERLVLNIIDYMEEYKNSFYESHLYEKNKKIQILWYLSEKEKAKDNFVITNELLYTIPEDELPTFIEDYNIIINKIKEGKAHEISEGDTTYLGACTKGANSKSLREQPFSNTLAKQRAFCLKQSYMTSLVRKYIGTYNNVKSIIQNRKCSLIENVKNITNKYINKSISELKTIFNIKGNPKNLNNIIVSRMFNINGKINDADEFIKANINPRTCRVTKNKKIIESVSMPAFSFINVANTSFEDSELRKFLIELKQLFFVFQETECDYVFKGFKIFYIPESIIDNDFKEIYTKTQNVIKSGDIIKCVKPNGNRVTNFPGMSDNKYGHVRPHGRNALDTNPLPVKEIHTNASEYTKQCFWINNSYLLEQIKDILD